MLEIILVDELNRNCFLQKLFSRLAPLISSLAPDLQTAGNLSANQSLPSGGTSTISRQDLLRKADLLRKTCNTSVPFLLAKICCVFFESMRNSKGESKQQASHVINSLSFFRLKLKVKLIM